MDKKINIPKKNAGRRLAEKLKELGQKPPPPDLMEKINKKDDNKKVALPHNSSSDLDI